MSTVTIELGDGRTVPMTPPPQLGAAFAAVIATALAWEDTWTNTLNGYHSDVVAMHRAGYGGASRRIDAALRAAGLEWSCQFTEPDSEPEAFPYINTLAQQVSQGAADVAAAVLARDLRLVTCGDFAVVTDWWIAAGQPLPRAALEGVWANDPAEIKVQQRKLCNTRWKVAGWPLTAVTLPDPQPGTDPDDDLDDDLDDDEQPVGVYTFCDYPNPKSVNRVLYQIKVFRFGGDGAWGVFDWRGDRGAQLGPDGDWSYPPLDDAERAVWRAERRFTEEQAVDLARRAAPTKTYLGKTIADMVAWEAAQPEPNPDHPGDPDYDRHGHHCWAMAVRDHHLLHP
jgi:hypothetical protein